MLPLLAACSKKSNDYDGTSGSLPLRIRLAARPLAATRPPHHEFSGPLQLAAGSPVDKPREWPGIGNSTIGDGRYIAWTVDDGASPEAIRGYAGVFSAYEYAPDILH